MNRVFVRIYELPDKLTDGYCFGGGNEIRFKNVDWFETSLSEGRNGLTQFVQGKNYYSPSKRYLVLGDHPDLVYIIERLGE